MGSIDIGDVCHRVLRGKIDNTERFVLQVSLAPWKDNLVTVRVDLVGIVHVTHVDDASKSTTFFPAHHFTDIVPEDPYKIRITNLEECPGGLTKR